jgi:UPF0755 protein
MKKYISIAVILFVFLMIAFSYYALSPIDRRNEIVTVDIPRGTSFLRSVDLLEEAGLIKNKYLFYALVIARNAQGNIRAGEYELSTSMSPFDIINKLVKGDIISFMVAIPEESVAEIAARLASFKIVDEKAFVSLARDEKFVASLGIEGNSVEGYLYPDTYIFDKSMREKDIIKIMVNQFWKTFTHEMQKRAEELGMTIPQVVTLASIIGKQAVFKNEKPLVSAVFHNRLKKRMRLQSDMTAIYGLKREGKFVKKSSEYYRKSYTSYNTYMIDGLPPGPIANPDIDSLQAALYPASVNYLYLEANKDLTHNFSTNIDTHEARNRK